MALQTLDPDAGDLPDEMVVKGAAGRLFAISALILGLMTTLPGWYLTVYSDRQIVALIATCTALVGAMMSAIALTVRPHYWQGGTSYRKPWFVVCVFVDKDGSHHREDHPLEPRPHWTDSRLTSGVASFSLVFAGMLLLAYSWGWFWF